MSFFLDFLLSRDVLFHVLFAHTPFHHSFTFFSFIFSLARTILVHCTLIHIPFLNLYFLVEKLLRIILISDHLGEMVIHNMREKRPEYNIISNNCQNFAEQMLDAIQIGAHQEFATAFAVYQRATGKGTIKDLFVDHHPEEQKTDIPEGDQLHRVDTVQNAQMVMDEQTTKLDNHRAFFS